MKATVALHVVLTPCDGVILVEQRERAAKERERVAAVRGVAHALCEVGDGAARLLRRR